MNDIFIQLGIDYIEFDNRGNVIRVKGCTTKKQLKGE